MSIRQRRLSSLLTPVRLSIGLGTGLLCSDQRQDHDRSNVRDHLEELIRDPEASDLKTDLQSITESEEQAGQQNAARSPASENYRRKCDKSTSRNIAFCIGIGIAGRQVSAADACQGPARAPQITQARYLTRITEIPRVAAALGCSPTAL